MAERRPLVKLNGRTKELPAGDTLPGAGGGATVPAGTKWETYSTTEPSGWYFLNGQVVSEAANPTLAAIFGASSGNVTLPDERGRTAKMADGSHAVGTQQGSDTQDISHTHSFSDTSTSAGSHDHGGSTGSSGSQAVGILSLLGVGAPPNHTHSISSDGSHTHDVSGTTGSGGTATLDVRGAVTYTNWMIKAG